MFTGIIESLGKVEAIRQEGDNTHFTLSCSFAGELKVDQSLAHNGVCLTVVACDEKQYTVTAIAETLRCSNLASWHAGEMVNLERCTVLGGRLDGHIVQGHVDTCARLESVVNAEGSRELYFSHASAPSHLTVAKGSVTVNGISLTVVRSTPTAFSVAVIPYTWEHTNFHALVPGDEANIEFDIIGKYVARLQEDAAQ